MRLDDFIAALYKAGWDSLADAQHAHIQKLHRELFPVVAELEDEVEGLLDDLR